jgi:voltage-gated potassium channel
MESKPHSPPEEIGLFQLIILVLSLVVLGALVADTFFHVPPEISRILQTVDLIVCIVFLIDFVLRFRRAHSKLAFMKWGWIDLLASVPSVSALRWGRIVRLLRILRLLRGLRSLHRVLDMLFEHRTRGGVASVALTMFLFITFSSVAILICERAPNSNIKNAEDAVWWSVTTITTVGYGDKFPVTTGGRLIAMFLMIAGVGLFGMLSGVVASFFLGRDEKDENEILAEIRALRDEVGQLRGNNSAPIGDARVPPGEK